MKMRWAALLILVTMLVGSVLLCPGRPSPVQAQAATSCAAVNANGGQLAQDLPGLAGGNGEVCLLAYAADGVDDAVVLNVSDATGFDAAKADAQAQLTAQGIDLCQIVIWQAPGVPLTNDEQYQEPSVCSLRFAAADAGASALLPQVEGAIAQAKQPVDGQFGWQQDWPHLVEVYTDVNTTIAAYQRELSDLPGATPDSLVQYARQGVSWANVANTQGHLGSTALLNLTKPGSTTVAALNFTVAQMYTGFVAMALGTGEVRYEVWFRQGFNAYLAELNGGTASGYLTLAAKNQVAGTYTPLTALTTEAAWLADANRNGTINFTPNTSRAYAAIAYLTEQYGLPAVIGLITGNHNNGSVQLFDSLFSQLTGMDTAAFDQALGAWLSGVPASVPAKGGKGVSVQLVTTPGGTFGEVTVTFAQVVPCGSGSIAAGTKATFTVSGAAGLYTGTGYVGNGTVTFSGTVTGSTVSGSISYSDTTLGCAIGPINIGT